MSRQLHEYACEDVVATKRFFEAESGLRNALGCDAYPEELRAAARSAERLADEASALARRLRKAGKVPHEDRG
jgi:hypothetical protein